MFKKFRSLFVAALCAANIASPAVSNDWSGFFIQGGLGYGDGDVELGVEDTFSTTLATDGLLAEARFGYRWQLWQNRLYIGPVVGFEYGQVSGSQSYHWGPVHSKLTYKSDLRATVGVLIGYQPRDESWLFTAEGGVAGLRGELCGEAVVFSLSRNECLDGYSQGLYGGLSAQKAFSEHLAGYVRLSHMWYELEHDFTVGNQFSTAIAKVDTTRLMFGLELRF